MFGYFVFLNSFPFLMQYFIMMKIGVTTVKTFWLTKQKQHLDKTKYFIKRILF